MDPEMLKKAEQMMKFAIVAEVFKESQKKSD